MPRPKTAAKPSKTRKTSHTKPLDKPLGTPESWLLAALPLVAKHGWREATLAKTAEKLGHAPEVAGLIFPAGVADLVRAFNAWLNGKMLASVAAEPNFARLRVRDKIELAVAARLQALKGLEAQVKHLLAWSALPTNAPVALRGLYDALDLTWRQAGDVSTDYNFYTKRGLLAGVVASTTIFWLQDRSKNKQATADFLAARIEQVMQLGKKIGQFKQMAGAAEMASKVAGVVNKFKRAA